MNKLTMEQKLAICNVLHNQSKFRRLLSDDDAYASDSDPAWSLLDRWISEILELNFRKDIYGNTKISEINRIDRIKSFCSKAYGAWFIGDALNDRLHSLIWKEANEDAVILAENDIKAIWCEFKRIAELDQYKYEATNFSINGELLYRRVESK